MHKTIIIMNKISANHKIKDYMEKLIQRTCKQEELPFIEGGFIVYFSVRSGEVHISHILEAPKPKSK